MVRYRRNRIAGGKFFFTLTLADRQSTALVDHVGALRAAFRVTGQERPFAIDAIVILPDHLHAILSLPAGRRGLSWTVAAHQRIFQYPSACCGHPVKHGLAKRVCDWPHSSFHLYVRRGILTLDWAGDACGSALNFGERRRHHRRGPGHRSGTADPASRGGVNVPRAMILDPSCSAKAEHPVLTAHAASLSPMLILFEYWIIRLRG